MYPGHWSKVKPNTPLLEIAQTWKRKGLSGDFTTQRKLNRVEVAVLVDELLDPFKVEVDWNGEFRY